MNQGELSEKSFGIIPVLIKDHYPQFLLIRHKAGHWGFPKGHAENGEGELQTAARELREETGLEIDRVLCEDPYVENYTPERAGRKVRKTVAYFVAEVQNGSLCLQEDEVTDALWCRYEKALQTLTFEESRQILMSCRSLFGDHL